MMSLLRAAARRPAVLLAGTILGGTLAFLIHVAISIGDLKDDLPVEALNRQQAIHVILEDLFNLHWMIEHAAAKPAAARIETLRTQVARIRGHLDEVTNDGSAMGATAAAKIHAEASPVLDDLQFWLDDGFAGSPPNSPAALTAIVRRTADATRLIGQLREEAHNEASEVLRREVGNLERFRQSLLPIMVQILLVGVLLTIYALRVQRLREAKEKAQNRLQGAIESLPVGFALFDKDARFVMSNERHRKIYPGPKSKLVAGASFHDLIRAAAYSGNLIDAVDPEEWLVAREAAFRDQTGSFEIPLMDGRILEVLDRRTGDGGTVAITADITESRAREAELLRVGGELREKNFQLDTALDNMIVGLAMFDQSHRLIMCNRRYLEIYGLPAELGRQGTDLRRIMEASASLQGYDEEQTRQAARG